MRWRSAVLGALFYAYPQGLDTWLAWENAGLFALQAGVFVILAVSFVQTHRLGYVMRYSFLLGTALFISAWIFVKTVGLPFHIPLGVSVALFLVIMVTIGIFRNLRLENTREATPKDEQEVE
ncbi:hypothetical protein [Adhaeretor mobilis]|uniref:Uncharacterized protein n=1 Tax=Adhaeretor mobilis TaxID=1930276 RepID=A0A517N0F6_9BACT|nr:hypothetical protein [Adhaeretor mobilis]QDT00620.1 hypothetical protein HG15A2_39590 [Adhaeretor mobilis]